MRELNTTSFAILGLLSARDWSAYEIAQQMRRDVGIILPRGERQLYDAPKRLVDEGFATSTKDGTDIRPRTVYSITDAGRAALTRWLAEPSAPAALEFESMVRVINGRDGTLDDLRRTIRSAGNQARESRVRLQALAAHLRDTGGAFPGTVHTSAIALQFLVSHHQNIEVWAAWALATIESWPDTQSPATEWRELTEVLSQIAAGPSPAS